MEILERRQRREAIWLRRRAPRRASGPRPGHTPAHEAIALEAIALEAIDRLVRDGLLTRDERGLHLTRAWNSAMARAALRLYTQGDKQQDIRLPIALALVERYGAEPDERLARYVRVLLPLERARLPSPRRERAPEADGVTPLWFRVE
jgi:hypothetical protein